MSAAVSEPPVFRRSEALQESLESESPPLSFNLMSQNTINMTMSMRMNTNTNTNTNPASSGLLSEREVSPTASGAASAASLNLNTAKSPGPSSESGSLKRFKHYQHPKVSDSPVLMEVCERCIENNDSSGLATIARNKGLPPSSRALAWPLLLKEHPFVKNPYIVTDFPSSSVIIVDKIPWKRINGELNRLLRRVSQASQASPTNGVSTNGLSSNGASTPPGGGEQIITSPGSSSSGSPVFSEASGVSEVIKESILDAVRLFLEKWGEQVRYDPGMVWLAYYLSTAMGNIPVDPEVFEHAMLVFSRTYNLNEGDANQMQPRGPSDSGLAWVISKFITGLRYNVPTLSEHFDQENMLSFMESEEWMLWWIKWYGVKAFKVEDAARLWDVYFAWREPSEPVGSDDILLSELPSDPPPRLRHIFCCMSILKAHQYKLTELDQSEMRQLLSHLPPTDMELVIDEALGMYENYRERYTRIANGLPELSEEQENLGHEEKHDKQKFSDSPNERDGSN